MKKQLKESYVLKTHYDFDDDIETFQLNPYETVLTISSVFFVFILFGLLLRNFLYV